MIHLIRYIFSVGRLGSVLSPPRTARRNYAGLRRSSGMDRQQIFALFFAFLMVSSMAAWGATLL